MASLGMNPRFTLQVDLDELRLILKALGGRLRDDDGSHEAAEALGDNLTLQRADELTKTAEQLRVAVGDSK